ncbi:hypothetical protein BpsS36_00068 [Bacillus phage vB_BpsS-36]|uniref:Terminase small subunit n=1 Tax=Bacillus phage vB_BpsS-36 TaxID=2419622 RepID=A0A3G3BX48_9CAUD|nr:hypothetical protein BpsS36_00001 [Bacillus phage vB_BpsS-36]AYP68774.1 hypothetical protein BpsS36_00068 [Bacillus phage vB_BpsS-36]
MSNQYEKASVSNIKRSIQERAEEINAMKYDKSRKKNSQELVKELSKTETICGAVTKATGKICTKPPVEGAKRCLQHGGNATGPVTEEGKQRALANLNPRAGMVHGMYSRFVMTVEEQEFYVGMMNWYIEELDLDPANILMLDRALRNFILNQRKEVAEAGEMLDESQSYNDYDTKFMRYMQALGMDRKFNVSKDHKDNSSGTVDIAVLLSGGGEE